MNAIPEFSWILGNVGWTHHNYKFKYSSDFRTDVDALARLTGVENANLKNLPYVHENGRRKYIIGNLLVFGQPIQHHLILHEKPKICPFFLQEFGYCRRVWEISPITACFIHHCLLIDSCHQCGRDIRWKRPDIFTCNCQYDFRKSETYQISENEMTLTDGLHRYLGLAYNIEEKFEYPLDSFSMPDRLDLLYFIAANLQISTDYIGTPLPKHKTNSEIHALLVKAVKLKPVHNS